jgi:hypothetical protein
MLCFRRGAGSAAPSPDTYTAVRFAPRRPILLAVGRCSWPERRSVRTKGGREHSRLQMQSEWARSSKRSSLICDRGRLA